MSAQALADAYQNASGKQWTQPIGFIHALFEVAVDVMKRTPDVGDNKAIVKAIAATNLNTVVGHIEWDGTRSCRRSPQKNIAKTPLVGGQWRLRGRQQVRHRHHRQQDRAGNSGRRPDGADRLRQVRLNLRVADVRPG